MRAQNGDLASRNRVTTQEAYQNLANAVIVRAVDDLLQEKLLLFVLRNQTYSAITCKWFGAVRASVMHRMAGSGVKGQTGMISYQKATVDTIEKWLRMDTILNPGIDPEMLIKAVDKKILAWANGDIPYPSTMRNDTRRRMV